MAASSSDMTARRRPWFHPLMLLRRLVIYLALIYLVIGAFLAYSQTGMIYYGYTQPVTREAAIHRAKEQRLALWDKTTPGAEGPQGFIPIDFYAPAPRGTIVFFHGNGESAYEWASQIPAFQQRGFRVFMYEYPGYGSRPGVPSEKVIVPDARAVVRALIEECKGPVYLWGQSLGTGVAAAVCADKTLDIRGLALVTPWDTLPNVGAAYYPWLPVKLVMRDKYDSIANLETFGHPVCVIRGDKDDTIPPSCTLNLFAHLSDPKKMILKAGYGHGDWPNGPDEPWWDEALDFIAPKK